MRVCVRACVCVCVRVCVCVEQLQDEERRRKQQLEEIRKREVEERAKQEEERSWREEERARREADEKVGWARRTVNVACVNTRLLKLRSKLGCKSKCFTVPVFTALIPRDVFPTSHW